MITAPKFYTTQSTEIEFPKLASEVLSFSTEMTKGYSTDPGPQ
jgi:hypothetical protein